MPRRIYVGPIHAIRTTLDGVEMRVERGEAVDVSDEDAKRLDDQPDNWAKPRSTTTRVDADTPKEGD